MSVRDITTLFLLVAFLNLFLFRFIGQVAFGLLISGFLLFCLFLYSSTFKQGNRTIFLGTFFTLGVTLLLLVIRDNGFVLLLLAGGAMTQLAVIVYLLICVKPFVESLAELIHIPFSLTGSYLLSAVGQFISIVRGNNSFSVKFRFNRFKPLFIGLLAGLPVAITLVILFSGADPIYAGYSRRFFSWFLHIPLNYRIRFIFSLGCFLIFSPFIRLKLNKKFVPPLTFPLNWRWTKEMTVVMSLIADVLASFLLVQWKYLFVSVPSETELVRYKIATYSEYVSKGFFELIFISIIIFGLIWSGLLIFRDKPAKIRSILPYIQMLVCVEFLIFILSIFRRIYLYQLYHGWSLIRIYGGFFLIWIVAITLTLVGRHFFRRRWVIAEVVFSVFLLIFIGFFNAESFIVSTHPPTVNGKIDYVYLSRLSSEGYDGWHKAFDYARSVLLNVSYDQKPLLDREDRREIAYAGMIVRNLTQENFSLNFRFSDNNFWSNYKRQIYSSLVSAIDRDLNRQKASINGAVARRIADLNREKEKLEIWAAKSWDRKSSNISIILPFRPDFNRYQLEKCPELSAIYCTFSFYVVTSQREAPMWYQQNTLDFFFAWNRSRSQAHLKMNQLMPLGKLIELQEAYFELDWRIRNQPVGEREYDIDTSLNPPRLN